jgi:hypothetical protein
MGKKKDEEAEDEVEPESTPESSPTPTSPRRRSAAPSARAAQEVVDKGP